MTAPRPGDFPSLAAMAGHLLPRRNNLPAAALGKLVDLRLFLETMWFLAINIGTMGMFLSRPFYWKAADGTLMDDGRVQRFMW